MNPNIILGITEIDYQEHVVCGRYASRASEEDPTRIEVIEIANGRLLHTAVDGGNLAGRIAVFGRFISQAELEDRIALHKTDPKALYNLVIKGTSH
jgi:hypothetical protein